MNPNSITGTRIIVTVLIVAAALATAYAIYRLQLSPVTAAASPIIVTIPSGSGALEIGRILENAGVIRSAFAFRIYSTLNGLARNLKAGTYEVCSCNSTQQIALSIASGDARSTDIAVTVPEGMNVWEIDSLLTERKLILEGTFARQFREREGTLFPDTYRFGADVASGSRMFSDAVPFADAFYDGFKRKAAGFSEEQVIIASMLEKEAKTPDDMRLVAGIIARRREIGMALQIDATVAYGWCLARWLPMSSSANCDATQTPIATEVKVDGPYNTYTRKELPAGPISNPGLVALQASANPTASDFLYYLSTRDGSRLIFSKTLEEHLQNRQKYLGF